MALDDFYSNVRIGLYHLGPRASEIVGTSYRDRFGTRVGPWLSPETVADYAPGDFFDLLAPQEISRLTSAVNTFRTTAGGIPRDRQPTGAEEGLGLDALRTIVSILETEKYSYADRFRIRKLLDQVLDVLRRRVDPRIESLHFSIESSSSEEDDAYDLVVWAVVTPDLYRDEQAFFAAATDIRETVERHLSRHDVPYHVSVMVRTSQEQARLVGNYL